MSANAQKNISWINEHVTSVTEWFDSKAAEDIRKIVGSEPEGLRRVIANGMRPLVEWFREFPPKDGAGHAYSELFDIWGRGGFSRIVAAVRADPLNSISVDATCVADINLWARIFCPLYDTVIVNWKGPLDAGLAIVPMPDNLGPPGEFGGQGYIRTSDVLDGKDGWHAAIGWANFLPMEVSEFLATEALPLVKSGRLVLLPASLVVSAPKVQLAGRTICSSIRFSRRSRENRWHAAERWKRHFKGHGVSSTGSGHSDRSVHRQRPFVRPRSGLGRHSRMALPSTTSPPRGYGKFPPAS